VAYFKALTGEFPEETVEEHKISVTTTSPQAENQTSDFIK
jgi:hypothetical protein